MRRSLCLLTRVALTASFVSAPALGAATVEAPHVKVTLLAATESAAPGRPVAVGFRFELEKDWHVYWRNPGDSGEPIKVAWELPAGVMAERLEWPAPERHPVGPLVNFGYAQTTLLPAKLMVAKDFSSGSLPVKAAVRWLVCREECIPGKATLELALPVRSTGEPAPSESAALFAAAEAARPKALPATWSLDASFASSGRNATLTLRADAPLPQTTDVFFFPQEPGVIAHAAPQTATVLDEALAVQLTTNENLATPPPVLRGVLRLGGSAYEVAANVSSSKGAHHAAAPPTTDVTLLRALVLAFLGGLILNGMPCVFPVLSIKAVGLLKHVTDRDTARRHGLIYAAGVLTSFWLLAGTLFALRAGGERLGWGFQLQSPVTISAIALLLFVMGLNLAGGFEIRAGWVNVGHGLASRREAIGAYFSGVLATVVATPCTAPFMGTALGFAASQPAPVALGVFSALALGLASPYVLLSWFPSFGRYLPKPGRWMETLKQVMAFPLFATVVWLLWVLDQQAGPNAVAAALVACLLAALGAWIYERWQTRAGVTSALLVGAAAVLLGVAWTRGAERPAVAAPGAASQKDSAWETFSKARLDELVGSGTPVFIDFTAAWCITCKVNELAALGPGTLEEMRRRGIVPMKADWTNDDPEISEALRAFGRDGVPLYVLYGRDAKTGAAPTILPQLLTNAVVLAALDELER